MGEESVMEFMQLGKVLQNLEIFRSLKYDEECNLVNHSIYEGTDNSEVQISNYQRKYLEMSFHEMLWEIISGHEKDASGSCKLLYCILRILMDPSRLNNSVKAGIIQEYIKSILSVNCEQEEIVELIAQYNLLSSDRLAYKQTKQLRTKKYKEYLESFEKILPLKPQINKKSLQLE